MKLSYGDKVEIYQLRKSGWTWSSLSQRFGVATSGLAYLVRLINRHGIEIVHKGKNQYYLPELKTEMFYGYEETFDSIEDLALSISDYIDYYNNKRIKLKLKGLSPVQYRTQSFT